VREETHRWFVGATGERKVAALLSRLGPRWFVLHSVPVGAGDTDIDHVVIGPGGVFTINTKHHSGKTIWVAPKTFLVNGQKQRYLDSSRAEASTAAGALEASTVTPIIALVGAKSLTIREAPRDVKVLHDHELVRWLKRRPEVLSADEVAELSSAASDARTWHETHSGGFSPDLVERFQRLRREDSTARALRIAWAAVIAAAAVALVLASFAKLANPLLPTGS
jgi:hypothetical protein